jgi:transmembrane sensor
MSVNKERLDYLLQKYTHKTCTQDELDELFKYIDQGEAGEQILAFMDENHKAGDINADVHMVDWDTMYANIVDKDAAQPARYGNWFKVMAAATILLVGSFGLWLLVQPSPKQQQVAAKKDIAPGTNKALLTLANGSTISLDNASKGVIGHEKGIAIDKADDGLLVYDATLSSLKDIADGIVPSNTLSTPRAGQYHVVLPDGSKVWLNAATSLTFPVAFVSNTRTVKLSGEAYFEVAKDKRKPFIVQTDDARVQVLGTHFNIMAYPDDKIKETTLLEGSVQIDHLSNTQLLKPGQQAVYQAGVDGLKISQIDTDDVIAWKNGLFMFNNNTIDEVMKQIERWYDVEIAYAGHKPNMTFTGVIPRNSNVSKVLHVLELTGGIKFEVTGSKITVKTINKY